MGRRGVRVGKVLGVEVILDPSWFLLAFLIAWLLAEEFKTGSPNFSGPASVLLGIMGAVLFFASVLSHELAHCVVARRKGIPVERITLFLLGGAAQISQEPRSPGDEAKMALAGPALSVVLGVLLFLLGVLADAAGLVAGAALFETLGIINLVLAVFNLLPGFPMDGGRVLRAAIWKVTGDVRKATRGAATGGRVMGAAMIAAGVALIAFRGILINGLWLALIGFFLYQAASASFRQAPTGGAVTGPLLGPAGGPGPGPTVGQLMTRQPAWVPTSLPLDNGVAERLGEAPDRAFPVVGPEGRIEGVLTFEGLEAVPKERRASLTAAEVMVPMGPEMVAAAWEPYAGVLARLNANPTGRFVVLDGGRLIGVLSPRELARRLAGIADALRQGS